jgi:hypothetical protein
MIRGEEQAESVPGATKAQFRRVAAAGRATVRFFFEGAELEAREGDIVLTAVLTNRRWIRRFEFGDGRRAGFCLMGVCQDCWLEDGNGRPLRACTTLVTPGMRLRGIGS